MLYILPLVFVISGLSFPLGVMFYWLASNIWTMAQQYFVIRSMDPGSEAALAREGPSRQEGPAPWDPGARRGRRRFRRGRRSSRSG